MKRGDVVVVAEGKPRPAAIVQSDEVTTASVLICPITSTLVDAPLYRITLEPNAGNALQNVSQLMVDRVGPTRPVRIGKVIGRLSEDDIQRLDAALALMLHLGR